MACCGKGRRSGGNRSRSANTQNNTQSQRSIQTPVGPMPDELVLVLYTAENEMPHMVYSTNTTGHYMRRRGATAEEKELYYTGQLNAQVARDRHIMGYSVFYIKYIDLDWSLFLPLDTTEYPNPNAVEETVEDIDASVETSGIDRAITLVSLDIRYLTIRAIAALQAMAILTVGQFLDAGDDVLTAFDNRGKPAIEKVESIRAELTQ